VTKAPQHVPPLVLAGDPVLEVLRELVAEVRGLRSDLAQRHAPTPTPTLSRADCDRLSRVLPAISGVYGSQPFACRDLVDEDAPPALRLVTAGMDARSIGSLFARAVDHVVDAYLVERCGDELHARLWRVLWQGRPSTLALGSRERPPC